MTDSVREYKIGEVVWHEGYKRYMKILSIVWDGARPHSYIVAACNTKGTIQVHAESMRPLTPNERGLRLAEDRAVEGR